MIQSKSQLDEVKLITEIYSGEMNRWQEEYNAYEEGYNFLAGDQYTSKQKKWFRIQRRPENVFNIIFPIFNQVMGDFLLADFRERVYPKIGGDKSVAKIFEDLIDHESINNEFKHEMGKTLLAGLLKRGVVYPRYSNEKEIDGSIVITNIDEFEHGFDTRAKHDLVDDGFYEWRRRWLTTTTILNNWPQWRSQLKPILDDPEKSDYFSQDIDDSLSKDFANRHLVNKKAGKYLVLEFHKKEWKETQIAYNPDTGEKKIMHNLTGKKIDIFKRINPGFEIIEQKAPIITICECIPGLHFYLDKYDQDTQDGTFDLIIFSPYNYGLHTIDNFGMFKNAKGPQKGFNDARNQEQNILNKSANVGAEVDLTAYENADEIKSAGNIPGLLKILKAGKQVGQYFKREDPPQFPFGHHQYSDDQYQLIYRVLGTVENLLGQTQTSNENASLFAQRVQQAQKSMIVIEKNIRRTVERLWNKVIAKMQANYTNERYFIITNPISKTYREVVINQRIGEKVLNDIRQGEYRIFASTESKNPTQKAVRFIQKFEILKLVLDAVGPIRSIWRWMFEESDIDAEEVVTEIEQLIESQQAQSSKVEAFEDVNRLITGAKNKMALESTKEEAIV